MKKMACCICFFTDQRSTCFNKRIIIKLFIVISCLFTSITSIGQQVLGSFPEMEGGFENTSVASNTTTTIPTGTQLTAWTGAHGSGGSDPAINTSIVRTGSQSLQWTTSAASRLLFSRSAASTSIANATSYVVQFYWWKAHNSSIRSFDVAIGPAGTSNLSSAASTGNLGTSATSTEWTKQTIILTTGTNTSTPRYGLVRFTNSGGSIPAPGYIFDDFCVYPGTAADVTAPNDATNPSATYVSGTQLNVAWTAPAGGVDGGGYVVVRYTTDPTTQNAPNANGIYKTGSTIGTNGTIAYIGTATSFTDAGLTPNTFYYYRVYVADKAFNYSANPVTFGGYTAVAVTPALTLNVPATPAASIERNSVTDIIYSFNLTQTAHFTTLTQVSFPNSSGTYATGDFLNFKLYVSSTNSFPGGTPLATINSPAASSPHTFSGFSQIIPAAGTLYFWITTDVSATAVYNNAITVTPALSSANLTFASATTVNNGTINAAGAQTIIPPAIYTWNGSISTDWQNAGNWTPTRSTLKTTDELYFPTGTWNVTNVPTQTISYLSIQGNVTLSPAVSNTLTVKGTSGLGLADILITAGSALTLNSNLNLTLSDNSIADISGVLNIKSSATYNTNSANATTTVTNAGYPLQSDGIINNEGNLTSTTTARLVMKNGTIYNHNINGGTIPMATWNTNSTCLISGIAGAGNFSAGNNQSFSKFIWDCPNQSNTRFVLTQGASSSFAVTDSFIVRRTGGKILQLTSTSGQKDITCGNYIQYGGIVAVTFETNEVGGQRSLTVNNTFYVTDSLSSGARFQLLNNPNSEITNGRLFVKGNVTMRPLNSFVTLEKVGVAAATAEIWFTGTAAQNAIFDQITGDVDFVNNHTGTGVTLLSNATANKFDLRQGVFYINGNTLTIKNAVSYNGAGTGLFGGSATSNLTLQGAAGTLKFYNGYQVLKNFIQETNSSATLGTELSIVAGAAPGRDSLGIGAVLNTNDLLILRSDADGTARLARVPTSAGVAQATIIGKVTVERYLPMGLTYDSRRWRLLTAPFKNNGNAPTINTGWQEGAVCPDRLNPGPYNPRPGYGTHITVSTTAANGFDQGVRNNPSIYYYSSGAWIAPGNTTSTKLTDNNGVYMLFARGDRSIIIVDQFVDAKPTTLAPKGELNLGDITVPLTTSGMQTVGNPYASAIKLDNVSFNDTLGKRKAIYLWDPKALGSSNVGKFITCQGDGNTPPTYTYTGNSSNYVSAQGVIESSGAFMVWGNGGNIVFHETDKIFTSTTIGIASRPEQSKSSTADFGKIYKLHTDLNVIRNNESILADGVASVFNKNYSNDLDDMDAAKPFTFTTKELLYIKRNNQNLAIERRRKPATTDTIFLVLHRPNTGSYQFSFRPVDFDDRYTAWLKDNYTGKTTQVDLRQGNSYNFLTTADEASYSSDRFYITFKRNIPAKPIVLSATQVENAIDVSWNNPDDEYAAPYFIERSNNGNQFTTVASVTKQEDALNWLDKNTATGKYAYRLRYSDEEGNTLYSNIAEITKSSFTGLPYVYPNPVQNRQIGLQMGKMPQGTYAIRLFNSSGQLVYHEVIKHDGSTSTRVLKVNSTIAKGSYQLEISNAQKAVAVMQVIME